MTDKEKLEKIRSEVIWYIHLRNEGLIIGSCGDFEKLLKFIDSMQEKPVSKDLEEEIDNYIKWNGYDGLDSREEVKYIANHFAKWKKENLWKPADGDDLKDET